MGRVLAWALFDLANTFFAVAMISFYFPLWVVEDRGGSEFAFSLALSASMVVVALLMPFGGALSDATGERMRYIRWTTYLCAAATALAGMTSHVGLALVLFAVANMGYQLGTVFYDALMWQVSPPRQLGLTSSIGAAFGYLGSALGLLILSPIVLWGGRQAAFPMAALCFLLFALPSFLLVREAPSPTQVPWRTACRSAIQRLWETLRAARALTGLWRYFWAAFFSLNAINTVLVFMGVYAKKGVGMTEHQMVRFFVVSQCCAIAGALTFARIIPHWGAKRTLGWIWGGWMAALTLLALHPSPSWLWLAGPVIGFCLGSTWATSRVLVMELSPKDRLAEMFGLAGLLARASSIIGPLLWGLLVGRSARYGLALLALSGLLGIGIWLLRGVPESEGAAVS